MTRQMHYGFPPTQGTPPATPAAFFARQVRFLMNQQGLKQSDLARLVAAQEVNGSCDRQKISAYLRGLNVPKDATLTAIAKALGVSPMDLVQPGTVQWQGAPDARSVSVVRQAASEAAAFEFEGDQVRISIDRLVSADTALKIMGILNTDAQAHRAAADAVRPSDALPPAE